MTQFFVFFYAVLTSKPLEREMACQDGELTSKSKAFGLDDIEFLDYQMATILNYFDF